jgi:hypothetical protein
VQSEKGKNHADVEVLADHRLMGMQSDASTWSPREALLSVLNAIDKGELNPKAVVICISDSTIDPAAVATIYRCSSPDMYVSLGLLTHVKQQIMSGGEDG